MPSLTGGEGIPGRVALRFRGILALVSSEKSYVSNFGGKLLRLTNEPWTTGLYRVPNCRENEPNSGWLVPIFGSETKF